MSRVLYPLSNSPMITFYRYLFLILTFFYLPFRGKATRNPGTFKTWIVINTTANIGDMVCTTPLFRAIKKHNPHARIVVVGIPRNEVFLKHNTDVDRYISSKQSPFAIIRELRREHADAGTFSSFYIIEVHNDLMKNTSVFEKRFLDGFVLQTRQTAPRRHILYAHQ